MSDLAVDFALGFHQLGAIPRDAAGPMQYGRDDGDGRCRLRHETRIGDALPGDEQVGEYSRKRLMRMDAAFVAAMTRAIERGLERRSEEGKPRAA
jgi:hypothetical protein